MSRAYGGKLGVWLTKKQKNRGPSKRQYSRQAAAAGSFLPGNFMTKLQLHKRNAIKANSTAAGTTAAQEMVGWDDVRCRPIYYSNDDEGHPGTGPPKEEDLDLPKTDSDTSSSDDDASVLLIKSYQESHPGDEDGGSTFLGARSSQWAASASVPLDAGVSKATTNQSKNKKQTYGMQKKKRGRLSSMATSVLDHCASPMRHRKVHSKNYGKEKTRKHNGIGGSSTCSSSEKTATTNDVSTMSFTSIDVLSILEAEGSTPPQPDNSVLALDCKTGEEGYPSDSNGQDNNELEQDPSDPFCDDDRPNSLEELQLANDTNVNAKLNISGKTKKRKIRVNEDKLASASYKKQSTKTKHHDNKQIPGPVPVRQPSFSTSLLEAKAYYDHLDATHELKIE